MHQARMGEPAHAVDHVIGAVQLAPDLLDGPRHKLLAQDVQDQFVALVLTLGRRHLVGGTAGGTHGGLLSAAGKGTDERDARPQGSYGFGRGIEGPNPSASQAEAGVFSARLGRLVCWLAPEQSRTRRGSQGQRLSQANSSCARQRVCPQPTGEKHLNIDPVSVVQ
jgi:hypothetical protein